MRSTLAAARSSGSAANGRANRRGIAPVARLAPASTLAPNDVLALQRDAGNQAVQRLLGKTLRQGSSGPEVRQLQQLLVSAGAPITADGSFGPKTGGAVVAFQKAAGLGADGVVGPKTWGALQAGGVRIGGGGGGKGGKADPRMTLLAELLGKIKARLTGGTGRDAAAAGKVSDRQMERPVSRMGWFDDAVDYVEDTASSAGSAVADAASSAATWVEEKASDTVSWVEDKAAGAASAAGDAASWVEEKAAGAADAVGGAVSSAVDAVGGAVGAVEDFVDQKIDAATEGLKGVANDIVDGVRGLAEEAVDALPDEVKAFIKSLEGIALGSGVSGGDLDVVIQQAQGALAGLVGDEADPLSGNGAGTLDFKKSTGTNANFTFNDDTFGKLRATLTARTQEIGSATPSAPALTINGKDGSTLPDAEVVRTAKVTIVENIVLPVWTNENSPNVQDPQRAEWKRYVGAVGAHEDLHADDDKGIYAAAAASLPGKTVSEAFDLIDEATKKGNTQGPARDKSDPAPILNPAGIEKA